MHNQSTTRMVSILLAVLVAIAVAAAGRCVAKDAETPPVSATGDDAPTGLTALEFLVGEWRTTGAILAPAVGDQAGPYQGVTVCALGGAGTWMACDFATPKLAGLGPYAIHVVIWPERGGDGFESFVVNNFGTATYRGFLEAPGRLVFFGGRRGGEQRIVYQTQDDGTIRFDVEMTRDGARTFLPHTESRWISADR